MPDFPGFGGQNAGRRRRPLASALRHLESRLGAGLLVFPAGTSDLFRLQILYDVLASMLEPFVRWLNIPRPEGSIGLTSSVLQWSW